MLFSIEADHGHILTGYLVPDGFSDEPSIRVANDGQEVGHFQCSQSRPVIAEAGRHETGIVGFMLDERVLPGLSTMHMLEIYEAKSGVLIYRRRGEQKCIQKKLLRLEFRMLPFIRFDRMFGQHFRYELPALERFGHETATQAFQIYGIDSIYLSGRLYLRNFEMFLDKDFEVIGHLPDPYYEMASRLAILNRLSQTAMPFISDRDRLILAPAAEYFSQVPLEDEKKLKKALQQAQPKVRDILVSPTTRQLVCTSHDQRTSRRDVAPAIDYLSRFSIVGQDGGALDFERLSAEMIGISTEALPSYGRHSVLETLADRLRDMPVAETMLEEDLILHHYVREAAKPPASAV